MQCGTHDDTELHEEIINGEPIILIKNSPNDPIGSYGVKLKIPWDLHEISHEYPINIPCVPYENPIILSLSKINLSIQ